MFSSITSGVVQQFILAFQRFSSFLSNFDMTNFVNANHFFHKDVKIFGEAERKPNLRNFHKNFLKKLREGMDWCFWKKTDKSSECLKILEIWNCCNHLNNVRSSKLKQKTWLWPHQSVVPIDRQARKHGIFWSRYSKSHSCQTTNWKSPTKVSVDSFELAEGISMKLFWSWYHNLIRGRGQLLKMHLCILSLWSKFSQQAADNFFKRIQIGLCYL